MTAVVSLSPSLVCPTCRGPARVVKRGSWRAIRKGACVKRCDGNMGLFSLNTKPASTTPEGTCQCCFRTDLKTKTESDALSGKPGEVSLHGYERPGEGFILGRCWGAQELPYEQSCEITKKFLQHVKDTIARMQNLLADLEADRVLSLTYKVRKGRGYDVVTVQKGAPAVGIRYTQGSIPSFEDLRQDEMERLQRDIAGAERRRDYLQEKVDTWKLRPLRKSTSTYEANTTKQAKQREERAQARATKDAKKAEARQKRIDAAEKNRPWFMVRFYDNGETDVFGGHVALESTPHRNDDFRDLVLDVEPGVQLNVSALARRDGSQGAPVLSLNLNPSQFQEASQFTAAREQASAPRRRRSW